MTHVNKQMISFFITTSCNLACHYCYTNKNELERRDQRLDFSFAKAGIDDFFQESKSRHIRFFGPGKPTVEFELIKKKYEYAYSKAGAKLTSEIQTNGVFPIKVANWLAKNINIIWVSSDGPEDIQDLNRVTVNQQPTSKIVAKNVRYLVEHRKEMIGIRSTITVNSVCKQKELVDYFSSLGVR